jgi:hypothetical protein
MRHARLTFRQTRVLALAALTLVLAACNPLENDTLSMSQLIVESMTGLDLSGKDANYVMSDVLYENPDTGATSIIADIAKATLSARMLDPNPITGPSSYADIQLTRYTVTFYRADGKNMPGVDVPHPFEGYLTALIKIGLPSQVNFVIVRETAKQEAPLVNLLQLGTRAEAFTATARVDFYGHDLTGNAVKASGYISVTFANYANSSGGGQSAVNSAQRRGGRS